MPDKVLDLSVVIPFKDKSEMTITCLNTLLEFGGAIREIILVSNNSSKEELDAVRHASAGSKNVKVLTYDRPFNYQSINNWAVVQAKGKVIMLLNNDIELVPQSTGLLEKMYDEAMLPENGAVGCVLLYEDRKTIQHAGVYLVAGGTADHLYIGKNLSKVQAKLKERSPRMPDISHDLRVTAVTAAAVMVERTKYDEIDGLNESFIICGGDVDLCLRLTEKGYPSLLVGASDGYMIHKESKSRSLLAVPYVDFCESYKSYIRHFDITRGDPNVSEMEISNAK